MTRRRLDITQRQTAVLLRAAIAENGVVEVVLSSGQTIRLVPPSLAGLKKDGKPVDAEMKGFL